MAYESIDSLQDLLRRDPTLLNDPTALSVLKDIIDNKNIIKNAYTVLGKEAVAKGLVPYFDMKRVQRKEAAVSADRRSAKHVLRL